MTSQTETRSGSRASAGRLPNGLAASAILSGAIGVFVIGLLTTLSEASSAVGSALNWYNPSGSLTGKTGVGIILWLVSWVILRGRWGDKEINLGSVLVWSFVLLGLGFLLTFPPFFELFK
ncbi:MAG: hypothetical protein J7M34_07780 [Anaerolineae bacterium]|nr:hypothetical protein [Anaerolineae bacterium]